MPKSRHRRKSRSKSASRSGTLAAALESASHLIHEGKIAEAKTLLEKLEQRYPPNPQVLNHLAYICHELGDTVRYLRYCRKLFDLTGNSKHALILASAYQMNQRPVLSAQMYSQFLEKWPDGEEAQEIRDKMAFIEPQLHAMIGEAGFVGEEGLKSAAMHEEVQELLAEGLYEEGAALALELIERHRDFAPAYNNLSLMQFVGGRTDEAIASARQVLEFAPDNFQALANLVRFLVLSGGRDEALLLAERLRDIESDNPDTWIKKAETFTFLCDDRTVLKTFIEAERADMVYGTLDPLLYHLAATAALHLGEESKARDYWKQSLKLSPGFEPAKANLQDLNRPVGERHGPWAYSLQYWLPIQTFNELQAAARPGGSKESTAMNSLTGFLERHPEMAELIPLLLGRSDPEAADFAIGLVAGLRTPELLEAVRDFALGKRGSDQLRIRAARIAVDAGLLPAEEVRMWINGAWSNMSMLSFEVTQQPYESSIPSKAKRLLERGLNEIRDRNGLTAERFIKQALDLAPDETRLLYNLAMAYRLQRRDDEWRQIVQEIHRREPDYFFGRVQMARLYLQSEDMDKAKEMLQPLVRKKRLHTDELAALCGVQVELLLKEGHGEAARSWTAMLEQLCPEHPNIESVRALVEEHDLQRVFGRRFTGLR